MSTRASTPAIRGRRLATVCALLASAAVLAPTGTALADTRHPPVHSPTEQAAALVRPAIVALEMTFTGQVVDETGVAVSGTVSLSGTCTGFGVSADGHIATAGHCVDAASPGSEIRRAIIAGVVKQLVAAHPELPAEQVLPFALANWSVRGTGSATGPDVTVTAVTGATEAGAQGEERPARVIDVQPFEKGDVALLDVDATDLPTLQLGTDADVRVGAGLLSIGYPASADRVTDPSLEPSVKDGQVSGRRSFRGLPVYETSAALSQGMSGGPTVDLDGRVLGVNSFMPAGEPQAFNFIAPASGLAAMLERNGVHNDAGPVDTAWHDALAAYWAGRWSTAIDGFDRVLRIDPQHAAAARFRNQAVADRARFGDPAPDEAPGPPVALVIGIAGGAVVLVGALGAVLVVRRRRRAAAAAPSAVPAGPPARGPAHRPAPVPARGPVQGSTPRPAMAPAGPSRPGRPVAPHARTVARPPLPVPANAPTTVMARPDGLHPRG